MKIKLYLLVLLCVFSMCAFSQMKVTGGSVMVGGYSSDTYPNSDISLYSRMSSGAVRLSFNYSDSGLDAFVGRYPCYTSPMLSQLHLHGKDGFYITSSGGIIMYYPSGQSSVYFNPDVIGHFYSPSDSRFKEDVQPLRNTLSGLKGLSGISYRLKDNTQQAEPVAISNEANADDFAVPQRPQDTRTRFGFLAQEVKEIFPELVITDSLGYMYVDYMGVVPLVVNALNELQAVVDSQTVVIEQLQVELVAMQDDTSVVPSPTPQTRSAMSDNLATEILPALYQNTPNPFNTATTIRFALPYEMVQADLYIYNLQGEQIRRIEIAERGESKVTIQGSELSAGMYIYALIADGKEIDSKRMILTK